MRDQDGHDRDLGRAAEIMDGFARRTGLTSDHPQQRYLWTDAFAVCNYLGLAEATGDEQHRERALRLVSAVHHTLGQHRPDDPRSGWLDGASEEHPTRGGLRIGKPLPERAPSDALDQRLEWDRDGQYFHYLTRWMHALDQTSRATGQPRYRRWARELAETSHRAFVYRLGGDPPLRMHWKMSVDLSRPLVASMGQHDPIDGYVTYVQLQAASTRGGPRLEEEAGDFAAMIERGSMATTDALGLGGLLVDAYRLEQLLGRGASVDADLLEALLGASRRGLRLYARGGELDGPAGTRLAFRELGLAIGLEAVARMAHDRSAHPERFRGEAGDHLEALRRYVPLGERVESFWQQPSHQRAETWIEHREINEVMLATALAPGGYLEL